MRGKQQPTTEQLYALRETIQSVLPCAVEKLDACAVECLLAFSPDKEDSETDLHPSPWVFVGESAGEAEPELGLVLYHGALSRCHDDILRVLLDLGVPFGCGSGLLLSGTCKTLSFVFEGGGPPRPVPC